MLLKFIADSVIIILIDILTILYKKGVIMSRATRTFRLAGSFVKFLFVLLIVFINALLIWRLFSVNAPKNMDSLSVNERLIEAYVRDGDLSGMFTQEQRSSTSAEENYGYFFVTKAVFIPSANQIQVVVRYNNSTLRYTQEDFGLDEVPSRDDDVYDVSLLVVSDLTPDNDEDNLVIAEGSTATARIHPTYVERAQTKLYNYRLFVFDLGELDLDALLQNGELLSVFTDIYYAGEVDYESKPYGTLCLYDYITEIKPAKLSSAEKKEIESFITK